MIGRARRRRGWRSGLGFGVELVHDFLVAGAKLVEAFLVGEADPRAGLGFADVVVHVGGAG